MGALDESNRPTSHAKVERRGRATELKRLYGPRMRPESAGQVRGGDLWPGFRLARAESPPGRPGSARMNL